jgi:hypothetical protein
MSIITENPRLVVDVVEMSLKGSEFAAEAWKIIRRSLLSETSPDGEELDRLEELFDRAKDDMEGPGLRVDLSKERIYL